MRAFRRTRAPVTVIQKSQILEEKETRERKKINFVVVSANLNLVRHSPYPSYVFFVPHFFLHVKTLSYLLAVLTLMGFVRDQFTPVFSPRPPPRKET